MNAKARAELGWTPRYDFRHVLDALREDRDFRSPLALAVGAKGYHAGEHRGVHHALGVVSGLRRGDSVVVAVVGR